MPDQIAEKLRAALGQRAAQIDANSITRLGTIGYQPRLGVLARTLRTFERLLPWRERPPR
jgi:hypothetical protein